MRSEAWASDSRQPGFFDDYIMAVCLEPPWQGRGVPSRSIVCLGDRGYWVEGTPPSSFQRKLEPRDTGFSAVLAL
jgi:hypothetical protein